MSRKKANHICNYESEIAVLHEKMDRLINAIEGNGKLGLIVEFNKFKTWTIVGFIMIAGGGIGSGTMFFELLRRMMLQ